MTIRASELKVGDVVNPPYDKSVCTVKSVKMYADAATEIYYEGMDFPWLYGDTEEFTYLGSKKEDNMLDQLCVYLDDLAEKEKENDWSPLELRQQLIEVWNLFCGVFDISLNDVKKLYFERKMGSAESKVEEFPETKLVGSLKTGDVVVFPGCKGIYTIKSNEYLGRGKNRLFFEEVPKCVYRETMEVTLISKQKTKPKIKRVMNLKTGEKFEREFHF